MKVIRPTTIGTAQLFATNVPENDYPVWLAGTVYGAEQRAISTTTHMIYESVRVASVSPVQVSVATPAVLSWLAHGLNNGTPLTLATSGALPTGLVAGTTYYVRDAAANTFSLAAAPGGAAIATSGTQSGAHTATAQSNYGRDPAVAGNRAGVTPFWREVGPTNRYRMFDASSTSQTTNAESIIVTLRPGRFDTLSLINVSADSVHVSIYSTGVLKFDKEIDMQVNNVHNLWEYFFAPVIRKTDEVVLDLPPYINAEVVVTIRQPNGVAKIGALIVGMARDIGEMQWAPEVRFKDYSRKTVNEFGDTTLVPGKTAKLLSCVLAIDNDLVDETYRLLSTYNGQALVWVGEPRFTSTIIYGFFVDFKAVIQDPAGSRCSLEIEGLT